MKKRVLLIGATGTFGSRLTQHLVRIPELHLYLTSRSRQRAEAIVAGLADAAAAISAISLHLERDLDSVLAEIKPWLVIDTSGPFQGAGYDVPRSALEAGAHYLDLADAQDFLIGFERELDSLAKSKDLVARAGCSTTPAITTAVVDNVTRGWRRVDAIDATIIPGGSNTIGPAIAAAVLTQAGAPITQFRHGRYEQVVGWQNGVRVSVPRLGTFRAVPAEIVDPMIMPERYALTSRMTSRAGLVSQLEQRGFELLASLRRSGVFKRVDRIAPLLAMGRKLTRLWSHDRGGMVINITGVDALGELTHATWSLLAQRGDGPHVPILPLVVAVRMLLQGELNSGAAMIAGEFPLHRIETEFQTLAITSKLSVTSIGHGAFERVLGGAYTQVPLVVRAFHDPRSHPIWTGEADIDRGTHPISRLVGWFIGLPRAGYALKGQVSVERDAHGSELWTRTFAGQSFHSHMCPSAHGLREIFGPMVFTLGLTTSAHGTELPVVSGRVFGMPIPRFLLPKSTAREYSDEQGRFRFDVRIDLPIAGLLAHYRGWLVPTVLKEPMSHDRELLDRAAE